MKRKMSFLLQMVLERAVGEENGFIDRESATSL